MSELTRTNVINTIAKAAVKKNLAVHKTAFFFNEEGGILSASDTKAVKTAIEALEGAKTPEEAKKATAKLKKAAEAAGLPEPVITAAIGKFVSGYGNKYSKGLKSFIAKDPEKAFGTLSDLPDPLGLIDETVMRLFLCYKGEVLCTNPFNKAGETGEEPVKREELKSLLKFARIWAKHKNLTSHIGWLIKSALVPDEHGVERAKIVLDCVEDYVKDLGFLAGAKEVYYYLFNYDPTYGPVAMGSEAKITRYLNGYYADKFTDEEALTWALKGTTSPEIAKLIGNRLGYILISAPCPVEEYENSSRGEDRFFDRSSELDGAWEENKKARKIMEGEEYFYDDKNEGYEFKTLPFIIARILSFDEVLKWALEKGKISEKHITKNVKRILALSLKTQELFKEACKKYNPQTPWEVLEAFRLTVLKNWNSVSPDAHRVAITIGQLGAYASAPDNIYLRTVDKNGTETVIKNNEFITNIVITLEELLADPSKLFERKNTTIDPITREVKEAEPEILAVGKFIIEGEIFGKAADKAYFTEDEKGNAFIDDIISGTGCYPCRSGVMSYNPAIKAKSIFEFESDNGFNGDDFDDEDDYFDDDDGYFDGYFDEEDEEGFLF